MHHQPRGEALQSRWLTITMPSLFQTALPLKIAIRPLFRMALPKWIPPTTTQQRNIRRELVQ